MRILAVDDDRSVLTAVAAMIRARRPEWSADCVDDAAEALTRLSQQVYDVILSDLHMPHLDGIHMLRRVKALKPSTPCVFLTGYKDRYAQAAWEAGAYAVLDKPIQIDLLIASLEAAARSADDARVATLVVDKARAQS